MCMVCRSVAGHLAGCPNESPRAVGICAWCNEGVEEGDDIWKLNGETYHSDCFEEATILLLSELGASRTVAEFHGEEDPDYAYECYRDSIAAAAE